ncbi:patatin-domain-containing protein [Meira miltonrushii]|uniref:Lysophospholipase NTE1 n=1 Tax=Meira miltonrushii TaxID=1280837 RepID=A0A316V9X4_9BASI|nr:patatin-domain-containing protein [Meira miltonrushii]PWN33251.1 patatin-domain-containing protein [Meira miltonrushii]
MVEVDDVLSLRGRHPIGALFDGLGQVVVATLQLVAAIVRFSSVTVPSTVYAILHYSFTLQLNFPSLFFLFISLLVAGFIWMRYRYLNRYERLREEPLVKDEGFNLNPDVARGSDDNDRGNFHNYLDDFLQAIRIFGFLEKPVFHELARHLQTRRLVAGDSISLDNDSSFFIVIDGNVQVFAHDASNKANVDTDDEEYTGVQLLNEVQSGGTLSSLFTILRLFTEDVKLAVGSADDEAYRTPSHLNSESLSGDHQVQVVCIDRDTDSFLSNHRRTKTTSSTDDATTIHQPDDANIGPSELLPPAQESAPFPHFSAASTGLGTIGRATVDTTLAVLPGAAFKRLTKRYPNAAAHIVQVILTRLSRVTFHTAHKYLGLTKEVMRTEKHINELACYPLPSSFYEQGGIERLRQRFLPEPRKQHEGRQEDYFSHTGTESLRGKDRSMNASDQTIRPQPRQERKSSVVVTKEKGTGKVPQTPWGHPDLPVRTPISRTSVGPGDLLSMAGNQDPGARPGSPYSDFVNSSTKDRPKTSRHRSDQLGATDLRDEVMNCIAKSIGLAQVPSSPVMSMQASPYLNAQDHLQRSVFKSAFGTLSMLDAAMFDDESSITGHSSNLANLQHLELENEVDIRFFEAGSVLARAGDRHAGLFYVIDGFLDVIVPPTDDEEEEARNLSTGTGDANSKNAPSNTNKAPRQRPLYTVGRGGLAGYLSSLLGSVSYVDVRAKTDVYVGFLPARALERMMERKPIVMLTLCKRLLSLLSPLILHIDSALDWQQVNAGQVIFREGDAADSFYIVINGRLRSITERGESGVDVLSEHGQGDSVGELDVITRSQRRKTLHAIRDSELVKMPMTLFNAISVRHPAITIQISRIIAKRVRDEMDRSKGQNAPLIRAPVPGLPDLGRNNHNLKTVAIVPVTRQVPVVDFTNRLQQAFDDTIGGSTAFLNHSIVMSVLGRHAFNRMGKLKLAGWLAEQEQKHRLVLYVVDTSVSSPWTQTSIRQADCILLVGFGDDPTMGEYERLLLGIKTTARKELVLLHPERSVPPGSTREWLRTRPWIASHHHVELPGLAHGSRASFNAPTPFGDPTPVKALRNLKAKLEMSLLRYRGNSGQPIVGRSHQSSDFARLARRLCGKSIGVVLGGGGARGISHVGFLRALEESGIPVDMVGGTSIGSLVGGLYAKHAETVSSFGRVKKFAGRMASLWRFVLDLTWPTVSYTTGFEFNRGVFKAIGETHIEDMWLPFFCNTTNITWSRMEVHTSGYAWRYIRASMTLAGLLPPLVDDGHMLVDGGYLSNLPVSVMFAMGARHVFAVDVGSIDDTSPMAPYGDTLSGWWVAINRYNPWSYARSIPSVTDIQGRLTYAASVADLQEAIRTKDCLYLRMPVEHIGTMAFNFFDDTEQIGYSAARSALIEWEKEGKLPSAFEESESKQEEIQKRRQRGTAARRNSV